MSSNDTRTTPFILLATTDDTTSRFVRETLEQAGFRAEAVNNRPAFLHALERRTPDLALIDARMPGGFEWCGAVPRKTGTCAGHEVAIPVVMLCDANEIARVGEVGAVDFALHPLSKDLIVHRVRHVLHELRVESDLETHRQALASTQRLAAVGTFEIDAASDTIAYSDEARRIFGWSENDERVRTTADVLALADENHAAQVRAWLENARQGADCVPIEYHIGCSDSETLDGDDAAHSHDTDVLRLIRMHVDRAETEDGRTKRVCCLVHEVYDRHCPMKHGLSTADLRSISGLPNQRQFLERVTRVIANAQPPHDQVAVLFIGLDLDEALTLASGTRELCLSTAVQRMKACIRDRDTLCHLGNYEHDVSLAQVGSEEFAILLPGFLRAQDAYKVTRRLQESLSQAIEVDGASVTVHSTIGISIYPTDSLGPETLLTASHEAMNRARVGGKSTIQFYTTSMNVSAFERMTLEMDLRTAIEREELLVYYQPKVEIATGRIVGVEALLRWQHPELGMVSPAQFIPIAEETGLIIPIGEYVLRVACAQNKRWQDQGYAPIRMAVNLSTVQFRAPDLHETVMSVLRSTGLAPELLELELTESVLLQKADTTIATLRSLKKMGVHLAIDDFGTGYSSLSYLKRFPIDSLKIDQSFIREVTTNQEDVAITTSIILMGRSLKLKVVAEGVESPSQLALLKVLECDEAQGYLFSRPVPADDVAKLFSMSFAVAQSR